MIYHALYSNVIKYTLNIIYIFNYYRLHAWHPYTHVCMRIYIYIDTWVYTYIHTFYTNIYSKSVAKTDAVGIHSAPHAKIHRSNPWTALLASEVVIQHKVQKLRSRQQQTNRNRAETSNVLQRTERTAATEQQEFDQLVLHWSAARMVVLDVKNMYMYVYR